MFENHGETDYFMIIIILYWLYYYDFIIILNWFVWIGSEFSYNWKLYLLTKLQTFLKFKLSF